jgi:hypothetical protein
MGLCNASTVVLALLSFVFLPKIGANPLPYSLDNIILYDGSWVDTWAAMPQLTEPANLPPSPFVSDDLIDILLARSKLNAAMLLLESIWGCFLQLNHPTNNSLFNRW